LNLPQTRIVGGDRKSFCIAAASIIAKVTRDRMMLEYDVKFPDYGFARHKGYCTPEHFSVLERLGPSPLHRRSFAPVWEATQRKLF
jgi:ribonuclease HII